MWYRLYITVVLCSLLFSLPASPRTILAQEQLCDPGLKQLTESANGYRKRGDRCEGLYVRDVEGSALQFVSLTQFVEDFNPTSNQNLTLQWVAPSRINIRLRAYSLKHRVYYRMDTLRPAGSTSFTWSPNMLGDLNLKKSDLGFVAWASQQIDGENRDVFLPLRLTQQTTAARSNRYEVLIVPGVELNEVFVSLAPVNSNGKPGTYLKQNEPLRWGYYPAERKISIALPELSAPGVYYLEIGATLKSGGSANKQVWFYHHN